MNIRLLNNTVLVKLDDRPNWHYDSNGEKFIEAVHNVEHWRYSASSGTVVAVCDRLTKEYDYGTTVEIRPDDKIIFSYMAIRRDPHITENITHSRKIGNDFIINYNEVYCVVRDEKIIPVNGWLILEGEMEETSSNKIIIPDAYKSRRSQMICTIKYLGTPNTHYNAPMFKEEPPESNKWKAGQKVIIPKWKAIPLQNEEFSIVHTGLPLYRAQRKDLTQYDWAVESVKKYRKKNPDKEVSSESEANLLAFKEFDKSGSQVETGGRRFYIHKR